MIKYLLGLMFVSGLAHAADMHCVETAKSKKNFDANETITINVSSDGKSMWIMLKPNDGGKSISAVADRDEHDSLKDQEYKDGTYNLDEDYDPKTEARFVSSKSEIASSDGDSIIFVDKTILKGKPGHIELSSSSANEAESGEPWFWSRQGEFACK